MIYFHLIISFIQCVSVSVQNKHHYPLRSSVTAYYCLFRWRLLIWIPLAFSSFVIRLHKRAAATKPSSILLQLLTSSALNLVPVKCRQWWIELRRVKRSWAAESFFERDSSVDCVWVFQSADTFIFGIHLSCVSMSVVTNPHPQMPGAFRLSSYTGTVWNGSRPHDNSFLLSFPSGVDQRPVAAKMPRLWAVACQLPLIQLPPVCGRRDGQSSSTSSFPFSATWRNTSFCFLHVGTSRAADSNGCRLV